MKIEKSVVCKMIFSICVTMLVYGCGVSQSLDCEFDVIRVDYKTCKLSDEQDLLHSMLSPEQGVAYVHDGSGLEIMQVIAGKGVLAANGSRIVFVNTTRRSYVDGSRLIKGVYVCTGICKYHDKDGFARTVSVYDELDPELAQERVKQLIEQKAQEQLEREKIEEQQRYEEECERIKEKEILRKKELEMQKIREENDRKIKELREQEELRAKQAERERLAKEEEEARIRYPEEQKKRAAYAEELFSKISFNASSYIHVQKDLRRYIASANVTEIDWKKLKEAQSNKDWVKMLSIVSGDDERKDYPDMDEIKHLYNILSERVFHIEFQFTHADVDLFVDNIVKAFNGQYFRSDDPEAIEFSIADGESIMMFTRQNDFYGYMNNIRKEKEVLAKNLQLGKITEEEAEKQNVAIDQKIKKSALKWLETEKVGKVGKKIERGNSRRVSR